jgi:signal transduction histidine kinase
MAWRCRRPLRARFDRLLEQVDSALKTVKRISAGLRPAMLDTLGLIATVKWYAADFSRMTGIAIDVRMPERLTLSVVRNTAVFRIVQEALTNVARHAHYAGTPS